MRILAAGIVSLLCIAWASASALSASTAPPDVRPSQSGNCVITGDKVASPARIRLGEKVQLRLTLKAECPPSTYQSADMVLIIDRSRSMMSGGKLTAAKNAAHTFVDATDLSIHQIGIVAFDSTATLMIGLSNDPTAIHDAIDDIINITGTNISAAIDGAYDELKANGRADALPVIVLMSDGLPSRPTSDPEGAAIRSANDAKLGGVEIFAIGLGTDASGALLTDIASADANYYYAPSASDLEAIYESIALLVGDYVLRDMTVEDMLAADIELVPGTASPPASEAGKKLMWTIGLVPTDGLTWIYQVEPQRVGTYPTNDYAIAVYTDADGQEKEFEFPEPMITVLDPRLDIPCDQPGGWTIMVHSFPDSIGVSGSSYPGCNNRFDSGDWIQGTRYSLPQLEFEVTNPEGSQIYFRGKGVPGPGRVDQRVYIRVCDPPPYRLKLLTSDLDGYILCPNSPAERVITLRDFRPTVFQRTEERFGFVR